jgi:hypothetical protein
MSTRCIQPKHLISLSALLAATLASAIWPSVSKATTVSEVTWNSTTTGLNLGSTGSLNLTDNALIIQADNATDAQNAYNYAYNELKLGYNGSVWTGNDGPSDAQGIFSDTTNYPGYPSAATDSLGLTGLGVAINSNIGYSVWYGVPVNNYSVLIMFTYNGDTDLDGIIENYDVNFTVEAFSLDQGSPTAETGWDNGESDYSGTVDSTDVNNVTEAYGLQGDDPVVTPSNPMFVTSGAAVSVPEPGTFALAGIAATGLLCAFGIRRRRLSTVAA